MPTRASTLIGPLRGAPSLFLRVVRHEFQLQRFKPDVHQHHAQALWQRPFSGRDHHHGAGGSVTNYSLQKAREMSPWGLVAIAPSLTSATRLTGSSKPATTRPLIPKTWKNSFQNGQSFSDWNGLRQALPYGSIPGGRALPAPMQLLGRK